MKRISRQLTAEIVSCFLVCFLMFVCLFVWVRFVAFFPPGISFFPPAEREHLGTCVETEAKYRDFKGWGEKGTF